ncbi:MAG TPA: hypothetical protein PKJ83_11465 [Cyclobacteriaceae bacterium]|nr:hypothetical protein [Cyclobacteriaceae bacterium]HPW61231.1 hypothetical protein [Cyclobacteriaceae bacterium]HRG79242.1 hypothetical protein [Cyclobacteriaceae bacterium]
MINLAFTHPNLSNPNLGGSYLKNFNLALINWELNRQEDRKGVPNKKIRKETR